MSDHTDHTKAGAEITTVMVVDPEIIARMVIADYLRECGYRVVEGVTGEEVFIALGAGMKIDIVFADVYLSGDMDGFSLARKIREGYPDIGVILTAGTTSAAQKASELCGEGPLNKPYHPHDVINRINILREQRRNSENSNVSGDDHCACDKPQLSPHALDKIGRDAPTKSSRPEQQAARS